MQLWTQSTSVWSTMVPRRFSQNKSKCFKNLYEYKKRPQTAKAILRRKKGAGRIGLPDFRLYYKATAVKAIGYWQKKTDLYQWLGIESPENNP